MDRLIMQASEPAPFMKIAAEHVAHKIAAIRNYEYPESLRQLEARPRIV
jgi:hypothetical protein